MKKIVILGLCFMIVLCSFVLSFAVDVSPVLLPYTSAVLEQVNNSPFYIGRLDGTIYRYSASSNDVYFVILNNQDNQSYKWVALSPSPGRYVYYSHAGVVSSVGLTYENNGYYYYAGAFQIDSTNVPISEYVDVIEFTSSFFNDYSVNFNISDIVNGSVSWLSSMSQAVINNGLLLFMVLVCFIGIGIGLLRRFTNG